MSTRDYRARFYWAAAFCAWLVVMLVHSYSVRIDMYSQHMTDTVTAKQACEKQLKVQRDAQAGNGQCGFFVCIGPNELSQGGMGIFKPQIPEHGGGADRGQQDEQVGADAQK